MVNQAFRIKIAYRSKEKKKKKEKEEKEENTRDRSVYLMGPTINQH